jgi:Domain of unknown function (DUF3597)
MTIFDSIKQAIVGHAVAAASVPHAQTRVRLDPSTPPDATLTGDQIVAVLSSMAANNSQKLYWQSSIVDLMKLVGIDPTLSNRKQLAQELEYKGDTTNSTAMDVWLHSAVMSQLSQRGHQAPGSLQT